MADEDLYGTLKSIQKYLDENRFYPSEVHGQINKARRIKRELLDERKRK